jgi:hypothetical protein
VDSNPQVEPQSRQECTLGFPRQRGEDVPRSQQQRGSGQALVAPALAWFARARANISSVMSSSHPLRGPSPAVAGNEPELWANQPGSTVAERGLVRIRPFAGMVLRGVIRTGGRILPVYGAAETIKRIAQAPPSQQGTVIAEEAGDWTGVGSARPSHQPLAAPWSAPRPARAPWSARPPSVPPVV